MQNKAYVAIIALVAYVVAIVTISSKCQGPQQQQQNAKAATLGRFQLLSTDCECDTGSKRNSNSINSSGRRCDGNELEDYFKVRFHEEIQNLVNGNETEYGRQIKMIQSQRMKEDLEIRLREMKQEFESKLSSVESDSQQRIFDMKKRYENSDNKNNNNDVLFPTDRVGNFVVNMARVSRDSFNETFFSSQLGYEFMESYRGARDLLLLYSDEEALPNQFSSSNNRVPFIEDAVAATENCDELRVVLITLNQQVRQCLAIVPNIESFHVHPLVRPSMLADPSTLIVNRTQPFQFKSRYHRMQMPSSALLPPPRFEQETKLFFKYLQNYLNSVDTVLQELRAILPNIAIDNQVVIMMCNYGQAVLLNNFICTAQARNINLSNLIVFTTDQETTDLVTSFGLTTYYDQGVRENKFIRSIVCSTAKPISIFFHCNFLLPIDCKLLVHVC